MSSKQREQGRPESDARTATAPATASEPIPREPAWRLLLGELWQPPEQQAVCRLLCCSRAMARLVHALCAGRVVLHVSRGPDGWGRAAPAWIQQVTAHGEAYSTWLAKHARLLAELRLEVWDEQEQHVAAGLRAAAGVADSDVPRTSTAAVGTGQQHQQQRQASLMGRQVQQHSHSRCTGWRSAPATAGAGGAATLQSGCCPAWRGHARGSRSCSLRGALWQTLSVRSSV
jgi:hypothetical protein